MPGTSYGFVPLYLLGNSVIRIEQKMKLINSNTCPTRILVIEKKLLKVIVLRLTQPTLPYPNTLGEKRKINNAKVHES